MVWGVIGWGQKSKLIFLEKGSKEGQRGINSYDYADWILPYLKHALVKFGEEVILIKDGAPIHKGYVKAVRAVLGILGIKWPASSLDLNAIKKIWRWIKACINEIEDFPITKEDLIGVV